MARSIELKPKAKRLYHRARRLQNVVSAYRKKSTTFSRKLKLAKKSLNLFDFSKSGLRSDTVQFCLQQLTRKTTKGRGRRFTLEEKLMSLALYNTSGPGYRFLSKWFNLPLKRTLSRLQHNIPVDVGINDFLMENLKRSIKYFKAKAKLCMLMFDDLEYNRHADKLVGIKNREIMDHALVFMVRGITRKWKQTVSYTFCKGTTKSQELKHLLTSIIKELKKQVFIVSSNVFSLTPILGIALS